MLNNFRLFASIVFIISLFQPSKTKAQGWSELGTGVNSLNAIGDIAAMAKDKLGNIYVGGVFTDSAGKNYVAKWDGTTWSELGTGNNTLNVSGSIDAITIDSFGNIYAAGEFRNTSSKFYVAKWNGNSWQELGTGTNALNANLYITALANDSSGNIYAAGWFTDSISNGYGNTYVARWNGSTWTELGAGTGTNPQSNGWIFSIAMGHLGNIYAVGEYGYVSKWNGNNWSKVGSTGGFQTIVIDTFENIYAAGGNLYANFYVAKWNGSTWSALPLGNASNGSIFQIDVIALDTFGNVYAGGVFNDSNNKEYVAKWDGNTWSELGIGNNALNANGGISCMVIDMSGNIYATGGFANSNGKQYVAKYSASTSVPTIKTTQEKFTIFPNPAKDKITIQAKGTLHIISLTGAVVYKAELNSTNNTIDVSGWSNGVYVCTVANTIEKGSTTLVVNH